MTADVMKAALVLGALAVGSSAAAQPRIQARPTTPPVLKLDHESGPYAYRVNIRPGVPQPGTTVTVEIELAQILENPDPTYGRRKPLNDAEVTAVMIGPRKRRRRFTDARLGFRLPDSGTYGFTFTAKDEGIYTVHFRGSSPAGPIEHAVNLSYGIWPIPDDAAIAPLPAKLPEATLGNLEHGRILCEQHCNKDVPQARPQGKTPTFLESDFAAALDDASLLTTMAGDASRSMSKMDRTDLLYYLRSLHLHIEDLVPSTAIYLAKSFTINEHGLGRLKKSAKIQLSEAEATGVVFIVYKGERQGGGPRLIPYSDTVARDRLNKDDKLGYVLFLSLPGEKRAAELALGLGREPIYEITAIRARSAGGKIDPALNRALAGFVGHGKFNQPRSLSRGPRSLRGKLTPVYLKAAELATMYYAEEREFTAFDSEFE